MGIGFSFVCSSTTFPHGAAQAKGQLAPVGLGHAFTSGIVRGLRNPMAVAALLALIGVDWGGGADQT
jgi:hypothetical protein